MNWLTKKQLEARVAWDYLKPIKKVLGVPFLPVTYPLKKMWEVGYFGLSKAVEGAEWTSHMVRESAKGVFKMGVAPWLMLAKSRLVTVKRFMWDVPLATVSAAIRTPIAIAKSPLEMVRGVRDAVTSIPGNAMEIFNSITQLRFMDTMRATRKAVTDVIVPPIQRPLEPIITPAAEVVNKGIGAETQTLTVLRQAITETIPEGGRRTWQSPNTASAIMAQVQAERAARKAALAEEKAAKQAAWQEEIEKMKGGPQIKKDDGKGGGLKKAA